MTFLELIKKIALFESKVFDILIEDKTPLVLEKEKNEDINGLIVKIMTEKFNKKYANKLDKSQTGLIKEYIFSKNTVSKGLSEKLSFIKESTIKELNYYMQTSSNNTLKEKYGEVIKEIKQIRTADIDDDLISKYLTLSQLKKELKGDKNE